MSHVDWDAGTVRLAAYDRQGGLCLQCYEPMGEREGGRWEAHHRLRRRDMPKGAKWCPCNIVALHSRCHTQGPEAVHDHPEEARERGLILDTSADPREVPVWIEWPWSGPATLDCESLVCSIL